MNFNHIIASQLRPENQFQFDPEDFDRAVLLAEQRRNRIDAVRILFSAKLTALLRQAHLVAGLASARRA